MPGTNEGADREVVVESVSIDELDPELQNRLRARASGHGVSVADEARAILASTLSAAAAEDNLADAIAALTDPIGGVRLDIPGRAKNREIPFGELFWDDDGDEESEGT